MRNKSILSLRIVLTLALFAAAGFAAAASPSAAPASGAKGFDTPKQAADALVAAVEKDDVDSLLTILGPGGKDVVSSGDPVEDKNNRAAFAKKAHEGMNVEQDPNHPKRMLVVVGSDRWPLPIPIVKSGNKWHFDAAEGREEILARRIGGNELDAIEILRGFVDAQHEYAEELHDGSKVHQYAQKMISSPGKQDGLSWKNADGTIGGPVGELIAKAIAEGHTKKGEPYNGYYFRVLTSQGAAAKLGARNYIINGMMIGGFAAMAWPANYGVTGIQTFLVNNDGVVYQKDLGPETPKAAAAIQTYNPDKTWIVTEDEE
ncbi:MAG TPA: DUF2950 domain-containing protein [Thermoanaerobaculia bacterium]|jgi:hypothetical protein